MEDMIKHTNEIITVYKTKKPTNKILVCRF